MVSIIYISGFNKWEGLVACGTRRNMHAYAIADASSCPLGADPYVVAEVTDSDPGIINGGGKTGASCALAMTIDSVEDLVAFSNNVSSGNNYSGKCIKLTTNLNFNSKNSYVDYKTTALGDVNGDGVTQGLRAEVTTGKGFRPISNDSYTFAGTFDGQLYDIYNLYINRPTTDNIGFFARNGGTIKALDLIEARVTGNSNTGGLVGLNSNVGIADNYVTGTVVGNTNVGILIGRNNDVAIRGNIVQGDVSGAAAVGGMTGFNVWGSTVGINLAGSVTSGNGEVGRIGGRNYYASSAAVNGANITSTNDINEINVAELALDTYIGGDNNSNGYYWDYEGNILTRKKTSDSPLTFSLTGTGVSGDPYLIYNAADLKQASLQVNKYYKLMANIDMTGIKHYMLGSYANYFTGNFNGNNMTISNLSITATNGYFIGFSGYNNGTITALNLTNENITGNNYIGGISGNNTNTLTYNTVSGTISGRAFLGLATGQNTSTAKQLTVSGSVTGTSDYVGGISGYNSGSIGQDTVTSITAIGINNVGGISGFNNNNVTDSTVVTGDITGSNNVGLGTGYTNGGLTRGLIVSGDVTGVNCVGGIVGYNYFSKATGIYQGGSLVATGGSDIGRITGRNYIAASDSGLAYSSVTVNGATVTSDDPGALNGTDITDMDDVVDINVADLALDTYIGGDAEGDGYYWDYDGTGALVRRNTTSNPLTFSLSGAGTSGDPYLIASAADLRQATLKLDKVFKLTANIDLTGVKHYCLGTYNNNFTGTFNGDSKTISNLTLSGAKGYGMGFSGINTGTITTLNLDNINVIGGSLTGGLTGSNSGTVTAITMTDVDIDGKNYVGGLVGSNGSTTYSSVTGDVSGATYVGLAFGQNTGTSRMITTSGTVAGTGDQVGGISGRVTGTLSGALANTVTVSGYNNVGGIAGYNNGAINNCKAITDVTAHTYGALGIGYNSVSNAIYLVVEGDVVAEDQAATLCAYNWGGTLRGIIRDGSVTTTVGTAISRSVINYMVMSYRYSYALSSITLNGGTVTNADITSNPGADATSGDLSSSTIYTTIGFNFTDENLEYIWYFDGGVPKFREGNL